MAMTNVLVVEDERALLGALEIAIDSQPDLDCVGAVQTVEAAMEAADKGEPDVVLMDAHLPHVDGIEGTYRLTTSHPHARVLLLTGDTGQALYTAAVDAGAAAFLGKDTTFPGILAAIRAPADDGRILVEPAALKVRLTLPESGTPTPCSGAGLTGREQEVLDLLAQGHAPQEIAAQLVVSVHTARGHVKNLMTKLGAHTQLEAVVVATRAGLLPGHRSAL
jgi:DNA-binding NarL/FixJ family response regulator